MFSGRRDLTNLLDHQAVRYSEALRKMEDWGIRISGASRLRQYETRITNSLSTHSQGIFLSDEDAFTHAFDLREIDEICEITEGLGDPPGTHELRRLRLLPDGWDSPDEEVQADARDAQYELLLLVSLRRGGMRTILSEPDVAIDFQGERHYLEAKRPKSVNRLDDRLRKAVSQLKGKGPSLVALSLDLLVRPTNQMLFTERSEDFSPVVARLSLDLLRAQLHRIANRVRGSEVVGLIFTTRIPGIVIDTRMATLGTSVHTERLAAPATPGRELVDRVAQALGSTL